MKELFIRILTLISVFLLTQWFEVSSVSETLDEEIRERPSHPLPFPSIHSHAYLVLLSEYEDFVQSALRHIAHHHSTLIHSTLLHQINDYRKEYMEDREVFRLQHGRQLSTDEWSLAVAGNPILSFKTIWRFANLLPAIHQLLQDEPFLLLVLTNGPGREFLRDVQSKSKWPTMVHAEEAMQRLLRLQIVYDLDPSELSAGRILDISTGSQLGIPLAFSLGRYARDQGMFSQAVPWLELIWDKLDLLDIGPEEEDVQFGFTLEELLEYLVSTMVEHDRKRPHPVRWDDTSFYAGNLLHANMTFVEERVSVRQMDWTHVRRLNRTFDTVNYQSLCSGESHQTPEEERHLFCWYDRRTHPGLTIWPLKRELLSKNPRIERVHEVISESGIQVILSQANTETLVKRKIRVIGVKRQTPHDQNYTFEDLPTVFETFLEDPLVQLNPMLEMSTGLSLQLPTSVASYYTAAYPLGGHHLCHLDGMPDGAREDPEGTIMATMLIYLDEPELGGGTAFPLAGISVKPLKGSGVFWFNLKRNGQIDPLTRHCACPVLISQKSILTKWIKERNQFERRPCATDANE